VAPTAYVGLQECDTFFNTVTWKYSICQQESNRSP